MKSLHPHFVEEESEAQGEIFPQKVLYWSSCHVIHPFSPKQLASFKVPPVLQANHSFLPVINTIPALGNHAGRKGTSHFLNHTPTLWVGSGL